MIMASELTTKVRLVRCPKCRKVLPELPELNVYKCGGCGATLQAKNRVNNAGSTKSSLTDADAIQEDGMDCVHEDKEELRSSDIVIVPGACEDNERDHSRSEVCEDEQLGGANLSTENQKNGSNRGNSSDRDNEGSEVSNEVFSPTEFVDHKNEDFALNEDEEPANDGNKSLVGNGNGELAHDEKVDLTADNEAPAHNQNEPLPADLEVPVNHESSPLAEASTIDTGRKSDIHSDVRTPNAVNSVAAMENGSSAYAPLPARESIVNTLVSSQSEQFKRPQKSVHQGYSNLKSEEFNPRSELSSTHRDMSKSPTRSSHAYDGSISSYNALDDQVTMRYLHSFKDTYKAANYLHSEERPRRDKFVARTMMNGESEMQYQARPSLLDKKTRAMKKGKWDHDEFLEPARHDRAVQNWRLGRHEHRPSSDFYRSCSPVGHKNMGPSNRLHNEFHRRSSFQSRDLHEDYGQVTKLLRMAFEMLNQLDKSGSLYDKGNDGIEGLSRKARYDPRYHNYETSAEECFRHPDYPRYYGRYGSGSNYSNRSRLKKIPFSGDATSRSHQVDPSCSHCFPQEWPHFAQLPPPSLYRPSALCRAHPGHNYCTSFSSCPSSPQWSMDLEYPPWGREMQSDDQRCRTQDMTNYLRDKHHLAKRHFRPIAGGAPFIVCYKCSKLLQLPADFLLFKRKCHRLRCGACSEVLKFSLQNRSHITPYTEKYVHTPPPSEAEDYVDEIDRRIVAPTSQASHENPVFSSVDHRLSHRKSLLTEGDPNFTTPCHPPLGRTFDKRILYGSDFTGDSKEMSPEQSQGKYKNRIPRHESSGPSSNIYESGKSSSEVKKLPPRSTSPLHRLMGYSSPGRVIFGNHQSGRVIKKSEPGN